MTPKQLRALLGCHVEYYGQQWTVEHVRTTWCRVMPSIDEVALVPCNHPTFSPLWVNVLDIPPCSQSPGAAVTASAAVSGPRHGTPEGMPEPESRDESGSSRRRAWDTYQGGY